VQSAGVVGRRETSAGNLYRSIVRAGAVRENAEQCREQNVQTYTGAGGGETERTQEQKSRQSLQNSRSPSRTRKMQVQVGRETRNL